MSADAVDGFVLAGGRASRMGVDKARLAFPASWPMATHIAETISEICGRVALIRRGDDGLPWPRRDGGAWEVIEEATEQALHPLNGLVTACASGRAPWVLLAPCDVPFLPIEGWRALRDAAVDGPVIAACGGRAHPLIGIFPRTMGPQAAAAAAAGASAHALVADAKRVELPARWLVNVNAPDDLGRVGRRAALATRLSWLSDGARDRLLAGEVVRLAARGAVDLPLPTDL